MFISFEGTEGSGKSSQIEKVRKYLKENKYDFLITKEPGQTKIGNQIRSLLLDSDNKDMFYLTELLLYLANRAEHLDKVLLPALSENKIVICDRFFDATLAYQHFARNIDLTLITDLHKALFSNIKPDFTFLLNLPIEQGLARTQKDLEGGFRDTKMQRFENEKIAFHKKVQEGYLKIYEEEKERVFLIDASLPFDKVTNNILNILKKII